ncbi:hypothetical protein HNP38_000077 [Chryseobacterium defluvii]|uniref:Uncharacterized protein n=1 Tax=Chryseobacterium defluvii TaxID=160396 RepID=A0A840K8S3_9FLAO|nr:hypothetical protein [Chryseobacterium defluvii]MBB4804805.1 hypothetical protein [Chryseobacterium defluvii]
MKKYNRYHSTIKTSYALGIQQQVLPHSFTSSIPRSTSQNWKELNPQKFVGNEFASQVETDLEQVKLILDKRLRKIRVAIYAFCRLYITIIEFIGKKNFEKIILQNREAVIDLVSNLPVEFDRNLVCKFLQITPHQFNIWKSNRLFRCSLSIIGYCKKRFPNQISQKEINVLKSLSPEKGFLPGAPLPFGDMLLKKDISQCPELLGIGIVFDWISLKKENPVKNQRNEVR